MTITHSLPADKYHAIRAVSAGMVHTFDNECAFKAWRASPWNSNRTHENNTAFTIGTAAHLAVLEPHELAERTVLVGFDDYRTKEARSIRDDAWASGLTPLKPAEWQTILDIRTAIEASEAWPLFQNGASEVTMTWEYSVGTQTESDRPHRTDGAVQHNAAGIRQASGDATSAERNHEDPEQIEETPRRGLRSNGTLILPCKLRADYVSDDGSCIVDLKTCDSAAPEAVQRAIYNYGFHTRAAWYLAGVEAATGKRPDKYLFVMVEKNPVGCVTVYELDQRALDRGDKIIAKTLPLIAECLSTDRWPAYQGGLIGLPTFAEYRYAEQDEAAEP